MIAELTADGKRVIAVYDRDTRGRADTAVYRSCNGLRPATREARRDPGTRGPSLNLSLHDFSMRYMGLDEMRRPRNNDDGLTT